MNEASRFSRIHPRASIAAAARPLGFGSAAGSRDTQDPDRRRRLRHAVHPLHGGAYRQARPKLLLPADRVGRLADVHASWFRNCAPLNVEPSDQQSFIASTRQRAAGRKSFSRSTASSVRAAIRSISRRSGRRRASTWSCARRGIAASCWAAPVQARCAGSRRAPPTHGRRSSRIVKCLGFLKGSHSPHYDAETDRRPLYQKLIGSGEMKPGYACDNDAGIYFEDNDVKRVVSTRAGAKVYYVSVVAGRWSSACWNPSGSRSRDRNPRPEQMAAYRVEHWPQANLAAQHSRALTRSIASPSSCDAPCFDRGSTSPTAVVSGSSQEQDLVC